MDEEKYFPYVLIGIIVFWVMLFPILFNGGSNSENNADTNTEQVTDYQLPTLSENN